MCILYRGEGSLPRNRAEIYEQCATLLFRKWDARRHIHQNLQAGHLAEPTLRHLAWWLFTREDAQTAVTERELINCASDFLHNRGFESSDDARNAAREFIEFCCGRMWVFTDTGTTADGEKLYSFTHRTFMEYFAAARLAYGSDTPEELAHTIAPHAAQGEWEIVGELAVQIKDRTSTDGARRLYETLLKEQEHTPADHRNVVQFLARTLRSVDPSPRVTRLLTQTAISFLVPENDIIDFDGQEPFSTLLASCDSNAAIRAAIDEQVSTSISEMIGSESTNLQISASRLLCIFFGPQIPYPSTWIGDFWRERGREYILEHADYILEQSINDPFTRIFALYEGIITLRQALPMWGEISPLLSLARPGGSFRISPYLTGRLQAVFYPHPDTREEFITGAREDLQTIGELLLDGFPLPWARNLHPKPKLELRPPMRDIYQAPSVNSLTYLGGAAILLTHVEFSDTLMNIKSPEKLGEFSRLYWYIESRKTGVPRSRQLPDLPIPEEFKQVFRDWAEHKINFVSDSPDPQWRLKAFGNRLSPGSRNVSARRYGV